MAVLPVMAPGVEGRGVTVTNTLSFTTVDALSVTVHLYLVLTVGLAVGLGKVEENPAGLELQT